MKDARWAALVGRSNHGRLEALEIIIDRARAAGVPVAGLMQMRVEDGHDAVDLATGERRAVLRTSQTPEICDWSFEPGALDFGRAAAAREARLSVLPAGRLEATGKGHWPAVADRLATGQPTLLCVSPSSLAAIALDLPDPYAGLELPASPEDVRAFADALIAGIG
jgi:hypothetical protein